MILNKLGKEIIDMRSEFFAMEHKTTEKTRKKYWRHLLEFASGHNKGIQDVTAVDMEDWLASKSSKRMPQAALRLFFWKLNKSKKGGYVKNV